MSAFELFQKQIESGSTEASLDAMKRLSVVSITMGPEGIQGQLLPYLTALVTQTTTPGATAATATALAAAASGTPNLAHVPPPSDEWLLWLAQELKLVAQFYMQSATAAQSTKYAVEDFLPILERLAAVEETVVREEAVQVFADICQRAVRFSPPPVASVWMALIKRLVNADWFTPKVSAAGILPHLFDIVTNKATTGGSGDASPTTASSMQAHPAALELLALYKELCSDETPMVRRAAAQHLGLALCHSGWAYRDDGLAITTVTKLCHDEQDSVRRLAVVSLAHASTGYAQQSPQWTAQHWLPLLKEASTDLSWYVVFVLIVRWCVFVWCACW